MGCAPYTCCEIPCGCCAIGFGWPLYHCICPDNQVSTDGDRKSKIKPSISTSEAFNTEFCRLRQAAIDNKAYRTAVNSWKFQSLTELISSLSAYCKHKPLLDQVWIVFYWITQNISYDADSYLNNRIPSQTAGDVFQHRKAVCEGYASLFLHLCTALGINCVKITGYAKGHGYEARQNTFNGTNHAWNAVEIGLFWYLVDSTWGEGSLDGNVSKKELKPYYFLVRPEQMIYTHLPEDKNWQLSANPITMKKFLLLPKTWSYFFDCNLELVEPNDTNTVSLQSNKSFAEVVIRCPDNVQLSSRIKQKNGVEVEGGSIIQYDYENAVWKCLFAPKIDGQHKLIIFAKRNNTAGSYGAAVRFTLHAPKISKPITFPTIYGLFTEKKCCLCEPLSNVLQKNTEVTFNCRIPTAKQVALVLDDKTWVYDNSYNDETLKITTTILQKSVTINAKFSSDKTSWSTLVEYIVR